MHKTIIADTSCFIVLANIQELGLLNKVYGTIITTTEIVIEFGDALPDWVNVVNVKDKHTQQILEIQIDKGESSAIALALETPDCTIILDNFKARRIAEQLRLSYTGTIGVLIKAKLNGIIPSIKPILEKMKQSDFRLSEETELLALRLACE